MRSMTYLWKRTAVNLLKKNIKRPVFWIYAVLIVVYGAAMYLTFGELIRENHLDSPEFFAAAVSAFLLYLTPAGYSSYARRKGLLFRNCDVHFVFPSPASPKLCLLYGQIKTLAVSCLMELVIVFVGIVWFHIPLLNMLLYVLLVSVVSTVMDSSLVICLYGNERLKEETLNKLAYLLYGITALLLLLGFLYLRTKGFHVATVMEYLSSPGIQMIPLIGWEIAALRLVLLGPDAVNVAGTFLYLLAAGGLFLAAVKLKCTGRYYEDAMKFADDYEQALAQKKKDGTTNFWKNRKLRKVQVNWKGTGASAIFHRQWLEYKKERFFLFSTATLVSVIVVVVFIYLDRTGQLGVPQEFKIYALLGLTAYLMLIFGSLPTKWTKELENPYVFLIPDRAVKKIWYATCLEHVKSLINMILLVVPAGIFMGIRPVLLIFLVWMGTAAGAVRIYSDTITRAILGSMLGNTGRSLLQMLIAWTFIGFAVPFFLIGLFLVGETAAFLLASLYLTVAAFVLMFGGSHAFTRMELQE